jgi:hypothetical protein
LFDDGSGLYYLFWFILRYIEQTEFIVPRSHFGPSSSFVPSSGHRLRRIARDVGTGTSHWLCCCASPVAPAGVPHGRLCSAYVRADNLSGTSSNNLCSARVRVYQLCCAYVRGCSYVRCCAYVRRCASICGDDLRGSSSPLRIGGASRDLCGTSCHHVRSAFDVLRGGNAFVYQRWAATTSSGSSPVPRECSLLSPLNKINSVQTYGPQLCGEYSGNMYLLIDRLYVNVFSLYIDHVPMYSDCL